MPRLDLPIISASGFLDCKVGIVCFPDANLADQATKLAAEAYSGKLEFNAIFPHITLFQAFLSRAPFSALNAIVRDLRWSIGTIIHLNRLTVFGDKYLFWHVERSMHLQEMHRIASRASEYFRSGKRLAGKSDQGELSTDHLNNLARFGYPLFGDSFLPHITLGFREAGLDNNRLNLCSLAAQGMIEAVELVKIGPFGEPEAVYTTGE